MFLDKIRPLFRKNGGKEKLNTEFASPRNEYYGTVAERYGTVQMVLFVLLTLFVLVALLINSEWISYENFFYFFSDFGDYLTSADGDIESIVYETGNFYDFELFGGKLAIAGSGGVTLYTPSGRSAFEDTDPIPNPAIVSSDSYMVVYDRGGCEYRVYNLFTPVNTQTTEYPIYGAAAADNGSYALITGDGSHLSCVKIFNRRFREIRSIGRASYVTDVAMSPSGDRTAVISYSQSDGVMKTHLYMTKTSKSEPYADITIDGTIPLYCAFTEKGCLTLVCEDRIVTYNTSGNVISEQMFPESSRLSDADSNRFGCSAVLRSGDKNIIIIFDRSGKMVYNNEVNTDIKSVLHSEKYTFIEGADEIIRLESRNGTIISEAKNTDGEVTMLVRSDNEVLLCMASRVRLVKF